MPKWTGMPILKTCAGLILRRINPLNFSKSTLCSFLSWRTRIPSKLSIARWKNKDYWFRRKSQNLMLQNQSTRKGAPWASDSWEPPEVTRLRAWSKTLLILRKGTKYLFSQNPINFWLKSFKKNTGCNLSNLINISQRTSSYLKRTWTTRVMRSSLSLTMCPWCSRVSPRATSSLRRCNMTWVWCSRSE